MKTRIISLALLTALLVSLISGCGSPTDAGADTAVSDATSAAETSETGLSDGLPELNFKGEKLTLFCTDYELTMSFQNMYSESETGDVVADAIYRKNRAVMERLNVSLAFHEHDFTYGDRDAMYNAVRASEMSGDKSYNILLVPSYFNSTFMMEGILADMAELPHVDFDKPWWTRDFIENATIGGKTYMAAGDGTLPYITGFFCLAFNKKLAANCGFGGIYKTIEDGGWTLDKMNAAVAGAYGDLNGDGVMGADDRLGLELLGGNFILPFAVAADALAFTRKGDKFTFEYGSEHCVGVYNKTYSIIHESGGTLYLNVGGASTDRLASPFVAGRALMTGITLNDTVYFRDLEFDYGLIPYPKWDEAQETYHTKTSGGTSVFLVPLSSAKSETVGAVLESMSFEGYTTVTPAYFEIALKVKYASDDETRRMLDLIKDVAGMDLGELFAAATGAAPDKFKGTVANKANSGVWASTMAGLEAQYTEKLDKLITTILEKN